MSSTNLQTTFAKSRLTRVCGLLSLLMMGVLQTTSAQQTADICLAGDTTVPLAVETSSINLVTQVGGQDANMVCIDNVELTYLSSAPPPPRQ